MKVTVCGINESYLKGAAPLQAVKCSTAYSFKLPSPRWKLIVMSVLLILSGDVTAVIKMGCYRNRIELSLTNYNGLLQKPD
jgi:hypothetical protein